MTNPIKDPTQMSQENNKVIETHNHAIELAIVQLRALERHYKIYGDIIEMNTVAECISKIEAVKYPQPNPQ